MKNDRLTMRTVIERRERCRGKNSLNCHIKSMNYLRLFLIGFIFLANRINSQETVYRTNDYPYFVAGKYDNINGNRIITFCFDSNGHEVKCIWDNPELISTCLTYISKIDFEESYSIYSQYYLDKFPESMLTTRYTKQKNYWIKENIISTGIDTLWICKHNRSTDSTLFNAVDTLTGQLRLIKQRYFDLENKPCH